MAVQAGLCLAWSETPEDAFCRVVAQIKTSQEESQVDGSFQADGHQAVLNKMNKLLKTNRDRTNNHRINDNRSTALERTLINY